MVIVNALVVWVHLVAAVIWLGGATVNLLVIMPSLGVIDPPPLRGKFMAEVIRRMGVVSWTAIVALVVTGAYNLITGLPSADVLVSTTYGFTLLIKILLATAMIAIAAYIGFVLGPKMAAPAPAPMAGGAAGPPAGPPPHVAGLQGQVVRMAKTNIILGLLVLAAVAIMRSV